MKKIKHSQHYLEAASNMRMVWQHLANFKRRGRDGQSLRSVQRQRRKEEARAVV